MRTSKSIGIHPVYRDDALSSHVPWRRGLIRSAMTSGTVIAGASTLVLKSVFAHQRIEQRRSFSCCSDTKLSLGVIDVIFDGARRDSKDDPGIGKGLVLGSQGKALPLPAGQMDPGEREDRFELVARKAMELIGDRFQAKSVTTGGLEECRALPVGCEGQCCEPAVPVVNGYSVAAANTETRRLVEEAARERIVASEVASPPERSGLPNAVQNNGIAGLVASVDVMPPPSIGVVSNEAQLPAGG